MPRLTDFLVGAADGRRFAGPDYNEHVICAACAMLVDLADITLPLPQYGFVNTGRPHTPFAFTLAGTDTGVSASTLQPAGGAYSFGVFSLSTAPGDATPYGTFGISINSTAGN